MVHDEGVFQGLHGYMALQSQFLDQISVSEIDVFKGVGGLLEFFYQIIQCAGELLLELRILLEELKDHLRR